MISLQWEKQQMCEMKFKKRNVEENMDYYWERIEDMEDARFCST